MAISEKYCSATGIRIVKLTIHQWSYASSGSLSTYFDTDIIDVIFLFFKTWYMAFIYTMYSLFPIIYFDHICRSFYSIKFNTRTTHLCYEWWNWFFFLPYSHKLLRWLFGCSRRVSRSSYATYDTHCVIHSW